MTIKKTTAAALLACGMTMAFAGSALAAGPGDWTGGYVGGSLGYGMSSGVKFDFGVGSPSDTIDVNGALVSLHGGYNWAVGSVVLGLEADAAYASMKGDSICLTPSICEVKLDQLFTLRGRVGVPVNNYLIYATLGLASGQVEAVYVDTTPTPQESKGSARQTGWVAGIGAQMAFSKTLLGRVELTYVDLGSETYLLDGSNAQVGTKFIGLKVGADWRF